MNAVDIIISIFPCLKIVGVALKNNFKKYKNRGMQHKKKTRMMKKQLHWPHVGNKWDTGTSINHRYSPSTDGLTGGETTADISNVMGKKYDQGEEFGQALIQRSTLGEIDGFSNNWRRFLLGPGAGSESSTIVGTTKERSWAGAGDHWNQFEVIPKTNYLITQFEPFWQRHQLRIQIT